MLAESFRPTFARAMRACALVALPAMFLASGCRKDDRLVFPGAPVILISVDTLRADHLPAYGYRAVDTPNLDALRKDGILYENAYAHVPLTRPSRSALSTASCPRNGMRDNLGYALGPEARDAGGFLAEKGYATAEPFSIVVARDGDFARLRLRDAAEPTKVNRRSPREARATRPGF